MNVVSPRTAARRLANELKLPASRGAVLCAGHGEQVILVVAADPMWRRGADIPEVFLGFPVEQSDQVIGFGQIGHA
jgi:hypothetical protein